MVLAALFRLMPCFYFHIFNAKGLARDDEGRELPDLASARDEAIAGIRSILAEELRYGLIDLGGRIEVADERDRVLLEVSFAEAVELRGVGS